MNIDKLFNIAVKIFIGMLIFFILLVLYKLFSPVVTAAHIVPVLIIGFSGYVIYSYRKEISNIHNLKPVKSSKKSGNIQTLATIIERASKDYQVSREQMDTFVSSFSEEDTKIEGKGKQYLKNIKEAIS